VPLFLPIYGNGRLSDIRAIAKSQALGQMNFNSGWEWYGVRCPLGEGPTSVLSRPS